MGLPTANRANQCKVWEACWPFTGLFSERQISPLSSLGSMIRQSVIVPEPQLPEEYVFHQRGNDEGDDQQTEQVAKAHAPRHTVRHHESLSFLLE
jgi:hypothetical protein